MHRAGERAPTIDISEHHPCLWRGQDKTVARHRPKRMPHWLMKLHSWEYDLEPERRQATECSGCEIGRLWHLGS
jgi:hypothetical protein